LIHPGANYINSIGCLNPASDLMNSSSNIGLADSHRRVVAIIAEIAARIGAAFPRTGVIPDATIVIREDM
jgi:hypothetical protein